MYIVYLGVLCLVYFGILGIVMFFGLCFGGVDDLNVYWMLVGFDRIEYVFEYGLWV